MKKKLVVLGMVLLLTLALAACGKAPSLSGRYVSSAVLVETNLEFAEDGSVTLKYVTAGYVALTETGTYSINEETSEITLSFPGLTESIGNLTFTIGDVNGTYAFTEGEGYIQIGSVQYEKVTDTN